MIWVQFEMFVHQFSYGLHKEQLKAGARGNSSLMTLPSWNEFVVATETPWRIEYCSLLTTRSVSGIIAATVEGQGQGQVCCRFSQGCQELLALEKVA